VIGDPGEHIGKPGLRINAIELGRVNERQHDRGALAAAIGAGGQPGLPAKRNLAVILPISGKKCSPLSLASTHGQRVRRIQSEQRASGELVHVELTPGAVTILPAWKLDAIYCAGLNLGAPQVSLAALCTLHELLNACESGLVSADGNIVTQEAQDGSAVTARTKDGAGLQAHSSEGSTTARSRSRRRALSGHDSGGAPSRAESDGAAPARGGRDRRPSACSGGRACITAPRSDASAFKPSIDAIPFVCLAVGRVAAIKRGGVDPRICQTFAASPAEPEELPLWFSTSSAGL
jgi:hypothetical protein